MDGLIFFCFVMYSVVVLGDNWLGVFGGVKEVIMFMEGNVLKFSVFGKVNNLGGGDNFYDNIFVVNFEIGEVMLGGLEGGVWVSIYVVCVNMFDGLRVFIFGGVIVVVNGVIYLDLVNLCDISILLF